MASAVVFYNSEEDGKKILGKLQEQFPVLKEPHTQPVIGEQFGQKCMVFSVCPPGVQMMCVFAMQAGAASASVR